LHTAGSDDIVNVDDFESSVTKPTKVPCVRVKIEKED
jgi:hypothetical protein